MSQNKSQPLLNFIAFLMAFCSVSYELLIGARLSRIFGEGMFIYPGCIGIFILFMGIGGAFWYHRLQDIKFKTLPMLLKIECLLTFCGYLSLLLINLSLRNSLYTINLNAVIIGLVMAALIGFLSGMELPLLFHLCHQLDLKQKQVRRIIFFDYCASFFASAMCTLVFFSSIGFFKTSILISYLNFMVILLILIVYLKNHVRIPRFTYVSIVVALVFYAFTARHIDAWENYIVHRSLITDKNTVLLHKINTRYQQVLLFLMRKDEKPIQRTQEEVLAHPEDYYFFVTLNGSLQFFEPFEYAADPDHTFLFDPYVHMMPRSDNVLILGGGDGLPARQAVQYPQIKNITMIDLDQEWVTFAKTNPFMRLKNRSAMDDPRVKIHFTDAFKWLLRTRKTFDLVIVDFPAESGSLADIRTTSVQFFRDLKRALNDDGVIVNHSNGRSLPLQLQLFARTATEAGLYPLFGFKESSHTWTSVEQLVLFKSQRARAQYHRKYGGQYLLDDEFKETREKFGYIIYENIEEADAWISFYDPLVSKLPFKKKLRLLIEDFWHG